MKVPVSEHTSFQKLAFNGRRKEETENSKFLDGRRKEETENAWETEEAFG